MPHTIGVIGTGYVGLVTGTCLAETGNSVLCIDVDPAKVASLQQGHVPIYEPGLDVVLARNIREQRIHFSLDLEEAVTTCELLMLCLPTPPGEDGSADLTYVLQTAKTIARILVDKNIADRRIVINKSTVPVGTTARIAAVFEQEAPGKPVVVVSNPEFLSEGFAVEEFMKPDRVVVGTSNAEAAQVMRDLYEPFVRNGNPILVFDEKSAEVTKYAANAFLATKISFMNDLSEYCEVVGADIESVRIGIGSDPRIGRRFLYSGIGYGGSCFPKDVRAIVHSSRDVGVRLEILETVIDVNAAQVQRFIDRIRRRFEGTLQGRRFALWGLSFKPDTDDVREAPAFTIINALLADGADIVAYDPEAMANTKHLYGDRIAYATTAYDTLHGADALVIATEWSEFRQPDWNRLRQSLARPLIFDGRNLFSLDDVAAEQFEYHSVGRMSIVPVDAS